MIELRAHHLLCLFGWRGRGYDEEFTDNFNKLIEDLKLNPMVRLVEGADDVCAACPNLDNDCCRAPEYGHGAKAGPIDGRVLERLGVAHGETHCFAELIELVRAKIQPSEISDICGGCAWLKHGWCADGLRSGRLSETVTYRQETEVR